VRWNVVCGHRLIPDGVAAQLADTAVAQAAVLMMVVGDTSGTVTTHRRTTSTVS